MPFEHHPRVRNKDLFQLPHTGRAGLPARVRYRGNVFSGVSESRKRGFVPSEDRSSIDTPCVTYLDGGGLVVKTTCR